LQVTPSSLLVETARTYTDRQGRFELPTPAGLEVQIFVDPKEAKNGDCFYGAPVGKGEAATLRFKS